MKANRGLSQIGQMELVLIFLICVRVLLNVPALTAAFLFRDDLGEGAEAVQVIPGLDPTTLPGVWVRWDSDSYLKIARDGYGDSDVLVNFFPGYPIGIRLFALGRTALLPWSGFLISNAAFVAALALLWRLLRTDYGATMAWSTIVTISLFPTAFFFSAVYAESLFLFFSVLVYWLTTRRQYVAAAVGVGAASATRNIGVALAAVPLVAMLGAKPRARPARLLAVGALSVSGLALFMLYAARVYGSPLAFVATQQAVMGRSFTWPGQSLLDAVGVVLWGVGGFRDNWFMRLITVQDLLALMGFIACAIASVRLIPNRGLVLYFCAATLFLTMSHGPYTLGVYAMARYVLVLFPGFMVIGILLARHPRLRWPVWVVSAFLLILETAWFAAGRWVA